MDPDHAVRRNRARRLNAQPDAAMASAKVGDCIHEAIAHSVPTYVLVGTKESFCAHRDSRELHRGIPPSPLSPLLYPPKPLHPSSPR
jgi:hypothetical protein